MDQNQYPQDHQQYPQDNRQYPQNEMYAQELRADAGVDERSVAVYLAKVMGWMCVGLLTTLTAGVICALPGVFNAIFIDSNIFIGVWVAQLAAVLVFSFGYNKMNTAVATVMFMVYAALTGVTFSTLAYLFYFDSLLYVFGLTGLVFFAMAVYGFATKKDLTRLGSLLLMGLFGIIVSSLINAFLLRSTVVDMAICAIGILLFIGLIAYDTQKIKSFYIGAVTSGHDAQGQVVRKAAIYGAFALYLDFINLFLRLLRVLGRRRS